MNRSKYPRTITPYLFWLLAVILIFQAIILIILPLFFSPKGSYLLLSGLLLILAGLILRRVKKSSISENDFIEMLRGQGFVVGKGRNGKVYGRCEQTFVQAGLFSVWWFFHSGPATKPSMQIFNTSFKIFFPCCLPEGSFYLQRKAGKSRLYANQNLPAFLLPSRIKTDLHGLKIIEEIVEQAVQGIDYLYTGIHSAGDTVCLVMGTPDLIQGDFLRVNTLNAIKFARRFQELLIKNGGQGSSATDKQPNPEELMESWAKNYLVVLPKILS